MSLLKTSKLNQLLSASIPGGLFFTGWLRKLGYSPQLLRRYRESGWLESLGRGVMYRPMDNLSALAAIHCYNSQTGGGARIAGHSALALHGFSHYGQMGKPHLMVAFESSNFEGWVTSDRYDMKIEPFHTDIFAAPMTQILKKDGLSLLISTPEQAFLECLLLVPRHYNYLDLYYIMEQLTALDPPKVEAALAAAKSQRVKRMFLYMAEKAGHYWFEMLDFSKLGLTASKLQLAAQGTYVPKLRITVPTELYNYE